MPWLRFIATTDINDFVNEPRKHECLANVLEGWILLKIAARVNDVQRSSLCVNSCNLRVFVANILYGSLFFCCFCCFIFISIFCPFYLIFLFTYLFSIVIYCENLCYKISWKLSFLFLYIDQLWIMRWFLKLNLFMTILYPYLI